MTQVHPFPMRERTFDPSRKFVRVRERRPDGFIVFDFAIGDPGLSVELMLPAAQFDEFCRTHRVQTVSADQGRVIDRAQARWSRSVGGEIDSETDNDPSAEEGLNADHDPHAGEDPNADGSADEADDAEQVEGTEPRNNAEPVNPDTRRQTP